MEFNRLPENIKNLDGHLIREDSTGIYLIVQVVDAKAIRSFMAMHQLVGVEVNVSLGFQSNSVEFLREVGLIEDLRIVHGSIESLTPIESLSQLKQLQLTTNKGHKLDFTKLPNLTVCRIGWRKELDSIFQCHQLTELLLTEYKAKSTDVFSQLRRLKSLSIWNSLIENLDGLKSLLELQSLDISNTKQLSSIDGLRNFKIKKLTLAGCARLADFSPLATLRNLESLTIERCQNLKTVEMLSSLANLKEIYLNNIKEIDSLKPLASLKNLEKLVFIENTSIKDGDLSFIFELRKLKEVRFMNRKHYSHEREELTKKLAA